MKPRPSFCTCDHLNRYTGILCDGCLEHNVRNAAANLDHEIIDVLVFGQNRFPANLQSAWGRLQDALKEQEARRANKEQ